MFFVFVLVELVVLLPVGLVVVVVVLVFEDHFVTAVFDLDSYFDLLYLFELVVDLFVVACRLIFVADLFLFVFSYPYLFNLCNLYLFTFTQNFF